MPSNASTITNHPEALWERLLAFSDVGVKPLLEHALRIAVRSHAGQWRKTPPDVPPVPYIVHPLRVALLIAEEWRHRDADTLVAAMLHDSLENCAEEKRADLAEEIRNAAGGQVCDAVWTLTLPDAGPADVRDARNARYFSLLRKAPRWVRLVKCADRLDNLRDARIWGDRAFWDRYVSETIGWHLHLAHKTAPLAEMALFRAIVEGERGIHGRPPVWINGRLVDPAAAALIPEAVAREHSLVGLQMRGDYLIVAMHRPEDSGTRELLSQLTGRRIHAVAASVEDLADALAAGLFMTKENENA